LFHEYVEALENCPTACPFLNSALVRRLGRVHPESVTFSGAVKRLRSNTLLKPQQPSPTFAVYGGLPVSVYTAAQRWNRSRVIGSQGHRVSDFDRVGSSHGSVCQIGVWPGFKL